MSLMDIVEVRRLVKAHFNGDLNKTALWMSTANPLLGNVTPEAMVMAGREEKLLQFVKTQLESNHEPDLPEEHPQ